MARKDVSAQEEQRIRTSRSSILSQVSFSHATMPQFWRSTSQKKRHDHQSISTSSRPSSSRPTSSRPSRRPSSGRPDVQHEFSDPVRNLSPKDSAKDLSALVPHFDQLELKERLERIQSIKSLRKNPHPLRQAPPTPPPPVSSDVLVVGAGPAGLMLA
jgi:hypothetical protein